MSMEERAMNWDDTIENDSSFRLIPDGDYAFTVRTFQRGRYEGASKIGPCPKAILDLDVVTPEGVVTIQHNLLLHTRCEGLLCEFFTCIGQRRHGQPLKMNWSTVTGARGRLRIGTRSWVGTKDGRTHQSNEVKRFLEPDEPAAPALTAAAPKFTPGEF